MSDRSVSTCPLSVSPPDDLRRPRATHTLLRLAAPNVLNLIASAGLAALVLSSAAEPAASQSLCKPILAIKQAQLSEMRASARVWTAVVDVDASLCASTSGRFDIEFLRLKENGPDLSFTEQFVWEEGRVQVSLKLWADEALHDYAIAYVERCACGKRRQ